MRFESIAEVEEIWSKWRILEFESGIVKKNMCKLVVKIKMYSNKIRNYSKILIGANSWRKEK